MFFSKVSNSQKKVLITPGLYFANYIITYLPHDFKKCEHVNLRQEWTLAVFEELYYAADDKKMADKKKADYQEGLEKSRAGSAARSHDGYMKDPEKSCAQSHESYMKDLEKGCADSAAQSRESYKNDLEKNRDDSAARSHEHRRRNRVVSSPDHFLLFLLVMTEKRVWWISVGRFVLQTPRFWESLIGADNYKGLLMKCQ